MKVIIKKILPFVAVVAMASSCERNILEIPDNAGNDPVFRLEMNLDNSDLEVVAGVNDIFNHTDYQLDQDDVYTFEGLLSDTDCNRDCPNSYRFKFRNYEAATSGVDINQSLSAKSYDFKEESVATQDVVEVHVNINTDAVDPKFTWNIDGKTTTQQNVSDVLLLNVDANDRLTLALSVLDESTGLQSSYTRDNTLGSMVDFVKSRIEVIQIEEDSVILKSVHTQSDDLAPLNATLWAVTDLNGQNPEINLTDFEFEIPLRIGAGKSIRNATSFNNIDVGLINTVSMDIKYDPNTNDFLYSTTDFDYQVEKRIAGGSVLALQTFEFELYDEDGVLYSSSKGEQDADSYFEILSTESFIENSQGQKTVKVTCRFSCKVYADNGDSKTIRDANAVIAVAIP